VTARAVAAAVVGVEVESWDGTSSEVFIVFVTHKCKRNVTPLHIVIAHP
jgi:hypothetical protein